MTVDVTVEVTLDTTGVKCEVNDNKLQSTSPTTTTKFIFFNLKGIFLSIKVHEKDRII